jgi:hypothetical protein
MVPGVDRLLHVQDPGHAEKQERHLSGDSQGRSFPKVPHLLPNVRHRNYYGRIQVGGKAIRESLKTSVWTTAKLRLTDFLKKRQEARQPLLAPSFREAVDVVWKDLQSHAWIKRRTKEYRLSCLRKIEVTWPALWDLRLDEITEEACKEWAGKLSAEIACHYYSNTIATLRQIIQAGIKDYEEKGGSGLKNPAVGLKRVRVQQKDLQLWPRISLPSSCGAIALTCCPLPCSITSAMKDLSSVPAFSRSPLQPRCLLGPETPLYAPPHRGSFQKFPKTCLNSGIDSQGKWLLPRPLKSRVTGCILLWFQPRDG